MFFALLLSVLAVDPNVRSADPTTIDGITLAPASMPTSQAEPSGFVDEGAVSQPVEKPPEEDEPVLATPQRVSERPWYQQLGVSGFLDAGFGVMWPEQQNSFFVGEVEIDVKKNLFDVAGLRIDLNLLNRLPWQPLGVTTFLTFSNFGVVFDNIVEQAYGEWFPLGDAGPRLRLGKYNAVVGHERQDATDRFMISQSLVFLHGSPQNFTGLMLNVPLPIGFSVTLHAAINGWDRGLAVSRNKTLGAQLQFEHTMKNGVRFLAAFTGIFGTDRFANERDWRVTLFGQAMIDLPRRFMFAAEFTWGMEPNVVPGTIGDLVVGGGGDPVTSRWFGVSAWMRLIVPRVDWLSFTARYDFFNDPQRTRGLVQTLQDAQEGGLTQRQQISANVAANIIEGALVRLEYNADFIQGREPDRIRALAVAHRLILQAVYAF